MSLKLGFTLFLLLLLVDLPRILSRKCHKGGHKCKVHENSPIPVDLPRLCGDNIIDIYKNICDSMWARWRRRRGKYVTGVYYLFWCLIWEIQATSTTTQKNFENAALFIRLGLPSTPIRYENGTFWKRSLNRRNLKTPALRFSLNGKHFQNRERKQWRHNNHTNPKWLVIVAFSNFSGVVWRENIWSVFRVKTPFSNLLSVVWMGPQYYSEKYV